MNGKRRVILGVAGDPVLHSLSPFLFKKFFRETSIEGSYLRVAASGVEDIREVFSENGFTGMNITSPFKEKIIPLLDFIEPEAKMIGAVNVVLFNTNGILSGYNTDWIGVVSSLKSRGIELSKKKCLVVGTGGAARSAAFGLGNSGALVSITGRDPEKSKRVAGTIGVDWHSSELNRVSMKNYEIIVSTIPSHSDFFNIEDLSPGTVLLTANYKDEKTRDTIKGLENEIIHISGHDWLFYQAIPSFKLFTGREIDPGKYLSLIEEIKSKKIKSERILITGFTGSGKSVTGKIVSKMLGMKYIDMDIEIEKIEKSSIEDVFKEKGEHYFRKIEERVFAGSVRKKGVVISCGGGVFKSAENRAVIGPDSSVFWVYRDLDSSYKSVIDHGRPLVKGMTREDFLSFYKERVENYLTVADVLILNKNGVNETAFKLRDEYLRLTG